MIRMLKFKTSICLTIFICLSFSVIAQIEVQADAYKYSMKNTYPHSVTLRILKSNKSIGNDIFIDYNSEKTICSYNTKSKLKKLQIIPRYTLINYDNDSRQAKRNLENGIENINREVEAAQVENLNYLAYYTGAVVAGNATSDSDSRFTRIINALLDFGLALTDTYQSIKNFNSSLNELDDLVSRSPNLESLINNIVETLPDYIQDEVESKRMEANLKDLLSMGLKDKYSSQLASQIILRVKNHLSYYQKGEEYKKKYHALYENNIAYLKSLIESEIFSKEGNFYLYNKLDKNSLSLRKETPFIDIQIYPFLMSGGLNDQITYKRDRLFQNNGDQIEFSDGFLDGSFGAEMNIGLTKEIAHSKRSCRPTTMSRFYLNAFFLKRDYIIIDSAITSLSKAFTVKDSDNVDGLTYAGDIVYSQYNYGLGLKYRFFTEAMFFEIGAKYIQQFGELNFNYSEIQTPGVKWSYEKFKTTNNAFTPLYNFGIGLNGPLNLCTSFFLYKNNNFNSSENYFRTLNSEKIDYNSSKYLWCVSFGVKWWIF